MNKIEQFIKKNKGCPLTPAATKQLLVKFIESLDEQGLGELLEDTLNIEKGSGTNAIQEKMVNSSINFTGRNPHAIILDPSLATDIPTGASGNQSSAFGKDTMALTTASFSNGNKSLAKGEESHAEGYQCVTLGDGSHAEGAQTVSKGIQSHAEGALTQAIGDESHAEGHDTISGGIASHSEGASTKVGSYSQEDGIGANQSSGGGGGGGGTPPSPGTFTAGEGSHAEGYYNIITGFGSHAEGLRNYLSGNYSHIEGVNNTNSGDYAIVQGYNNINTGDCSLIIGVWNNNTAYNSFVSGHHNKNTHDNKSVFGKYNADTSALLEVGNGIDDNHRSNIFEVHEDGIKIGTTKLTETQLVQLLLLIN